MYFKISFKRFQVSFEIKVLIVQIEACFAPLRFIIDYSSEYTIRCSYQIGVFSNGFQVQIIERMHDAL